jgi:hypothetical protein
VNFHVGQKVVCVDRGPNGRLYPGERNAVVGSVYTIREIIVSFDEGWGVYLAEIVNPVVTTATGHLERAFHKGRFRPIVETKTDISIFTAMLPPTVPRKLDRTVIATNSPQQHR